MDTISFLSNRIDRKSRCTWIGFREQSQNTEVLDLLVLSSFRRYLTISSVYPSVFVHHYETLLILILIQNALVGLLVHLIEHSLYTVAKWYMCVCTVRVLSDKHSTEKKVPTLSTRVVTSEQIPSDTKHLKAMIVRKLLFIVITNAFERLRHNTGSLSI